MVRRSPAVYALSMDEFEAMKERVRALREEVPSKRGILTRIAAEGEAGPLVEAAVEAVFNEGGGSSLDPPGSKRSALGSLLDVVWTLAFLVVSFVGGTVVTHLAFPDAGALSVVHILGIGAVAVALKVLGAVWRTISQ